MEQVYFDESGDFDNPRERCAIGGLRVSEESASFDRTRWIDLLDRTLPWVPWPPHATHVRHIGFHLLWVLADAKRRKRAPPDHCIRAYQLFDPQTRGDVDSVVERLSKTPSWAANPMFEVANRVRQYVRNDGDVLRSLTAIRDHAVREMGGLIARAVERVRDDNGEVSFIGAGEDTPSDAAASSDAQAREGRFLSLLGVALRRLRSLRDLRSGGDAGDTSVIEVVICRRSQLVAADVTNVIHRIYPPGAGIPTAPCPMRAARPIDCNAPPVTPPSVTSDWLANRLGHVMRGSRIERRSLDKVLEETLAGLGLVPMAGEPSPLAATAATVCRWAIEQEESWSP